jgi:N-acetylated-alpha-linked acidic dipeptidase
MAGGHRDAWTFGGRDPLSGAVSLLETARAFGELAKTGWRPRRTIAFASWDGEDFGLLGSTEWVEEFKEDCVANGVLYINRESYTAGRFGASGSHSLVPFIYGATQSVKDPGDPESTIYDAWEAARRGSPSEGGPRVGALGSGSDYSAFIDFAGVSAINMGFSGVNGLYHSIYDTYTYYKKFGDPGFKYGVNLAGLVAVMMLRMAEAPVLPFDHRSYANQILLYIDELEALGKDRDGFDAVGLEAVREAAEAFGAAADEANALAKDLSARATAQPGSSTDARDRLNRAFLQVERDLTDPRGLPRRPWFKHLIYAPGFYLGYGVKTLPGVREALEDGNMDVAAEEARRLEAGLRRAAQTLSSAVSGSAT